MNTFKCSVLTFFLCLVALVSCSKESSYKEESSIQRITPDIEYVPSLIKTFDKTFKKVLSSKSDLDDTQIQNLFLSEAPTEGLKIYRDANLAYSLPENFSQEFLKFHSEIGKSSAFNNKSAYKQHLLDLNSKILSSILSNKEKRSLITKIAFMNSFVDWMATIQEVAIVATPPFGDPHFLEDSWWTSWGKCAAGAVGGALVGGVGAAAGGSLLATLGAIGGGLVGAATFC